MSLTSRARSIQKRLPWRGYQTIVEDLRRQRLRPEHDDRFPATVLIEVAWVLRVTFKQDRAIIAGSLRKLIDAVGVTVEREAVTRRAIAAFEAGTADFSDYFIRESSREASALPVLTFDENFAREVDVQLVPPK